MSNLSNRTDLNTEALRRYATENIPGLLFVTVSGAHLYGFPSPDSDVDLRGTYAAPLELILSLNKPKETRETEGLLEDAQEVELVGHEIEKYLRLLAKPNGYVLEQILSPLVILTSAAHEELKALAQASLSRRLYHHYAGFARGQWREYQKPDAAKTVKRLLYLHRVLMTGIVLLNEGIVEANLERLNVRFGLDLTALIAAKTREMTLVVGSTRPHEDAVTRLFARLDEAFVNSPLPEDVPNRDALSDFLVRTRLERM
jgi:predicted nucleotidyltransferase